MQRRVELLQDFRSCPWLAVIRLPSLRSRLLWPLRGGRSLRQNLLDESERHGGGENGAISGLFDLEAVEERLYICVSTVFADAAFGGVKDAEKGGGLLGDGLSVRFAVGERFDAQMESAGLKRG